MGKLIYGPEALARYLLGIVKALDRVGNAVLAGDPDETISSRLGRIKRANGGRIPWSRPVAKTAEKALDKMDPGHCEKHLEEGDGDGGLADRPSGPLPWAPPPPFPLDKEGT